jgi:hypothetical protein
MNYQPDLFHPTTVNMPLETNSKPLASGVVPLIGITALKRRVDGAATLYL